MGWFTTLNRHAALSTRRLPRNHDRRHQEGPTLARGRAFLFALDDSTCLLRMIDPDQAILVVDSYRNLRDGRHMEKHCSIADCDRPRHGKTSRCEGHLREYKAVQARRYRGGEYVPKRTLPRTCRVCGDPALPDRLLCSEHRNASAREQRELQASANALKPCTWGGCARLRHQMPSQTVPYCLEHWNAYTAQLAAVRRPEPVALQKTCPECQTAFETMSPSAVYDRNECKLEAKNRQVRQRNITEVSVDGKRCCSCRSEKAADEFYRNRSSLDGLSPRCKKCDRDSKVAVELANPRAVQKQEIRKRLRRYNIVAAAQRLVGYAGSDEIEAHDAIFDRQGGICPWCEKSGTRQTEPFRHEGLERWSASKTVLVIDHDHECCPSGSSCGGCVRKLMHRGCNLQYQGILAETLQRLERMRRVEGAFTG